MKRNQRNTASVPITIGLGLLLSLVITVLAAVWIAMMVLGERMEPGHIYFGSAATLLLASFIGALYVVLTMGEKRLLFSAISGGVYLIVLGCMTILFFDGMFVNVWQALILVIGGSVSAGIIKMNSKKTSYRNRRKHIRSR